MTELNRRDFLSTASAVGGAMVIGFWLPMREAKAAAVNAEPWYQDAKVPEINAWLTIAPDNTVTVRVGQSEVGTGVFTAFPMMIAEELQCDWTKVRAEYASANRNVRERAPEWSLPIPGKGQYDPTGAGEPVELERANGVYRRLSTGSSGAIRESRYYVQLAGAEARERLLLAASQKWKVPTTELAAKDGIITHGATGRTVTYGALAATAAKLQLAEPEKLKIKTPDQWTLMGTEQKNLDVPVKVTGEATFGSDVRLPGMLYAATKACPVWGGDIKSYDDGAVRKMPGVRSVVRIPRGPMFESGSVAVVADSWWRAKRALDALQVEWDYGPNAHVSSDDIYKANIASFETPALETINQGDFDRAIQKAAKVVEATYSAPFLAHFCMEPGNATALVTPERVDLWVGDQSADGALRAAARVTGMKPENVYVNATFGGGGFGSSRGPVIYQALTIAKTLPGTPVKVIWSRDQDVQTGDHYRPAGVAIFRAGLDADGWPVAMHVQTSGDHLKGLSSWRGLWNMPYFVENYRYEMKKAGPFHVPTGFRRGTGTSLNAFYLESFMDELAHAADRDPYLYRREMLARNPAPPTLGIGKFRFRDDWIKALDMVAKMSDWGSPLPKGWARSIVIDDRRRPERNTGTVNAQVHTVEVTPAGKVKLHRVDVVFDEGFGYVNPLTVRKQVEGQIAFGYNDALYQEMTIKDGRAVQSNYHDYKVARLDEYPPQVNIAFLKTNRWIEGVGEEAMSTVAPAIVNAVARVTDKRIRSLPLKNHDLSWT
jgi:isoquinoline 1-oxidoreductase beta subunit